MFEASDENTRHKITLYDRSVEEEYPMVEGVCCRWRRFGTTSACGTRLRCVCVCDAGAMDWEEDKNTEYKMWYYG